MRGFFSFKKSSKKEMLTFTKGMYYLLNGKVGIIDALEIISENFKDDFRIKILQTKKEIEKGTELSKAFLKITNNREFLEMIKIGEKTGQLEEIFKNLYEKYDFNFKIKKEIKNLSIYPITVMITAIVIVGILLKLVIPKFKIIYSDIGQELPNITKNVIKMSDFLDRYWIFLILGLSLIAILITIFINKNKIFFEQKLLKMIIIGKLYKEIKILNFTKNMSSLVNASISLTEALKLCSFSSEKSTSQNSIFSEEIDKIRKKIIKGQSVQKAFSSSKVFDKEYVNFINIGEKTGDLKTSFSNLNDIYYERVNEKVKLFLKILEPLSIVIIGIIIGFIIFAIMLPMFKMGEVL